MYNFKFENFNLNHKNRHDLKWRGSCSVREEYIGS